MIKIPALIFITKVKNLRPYHQLKFNSLLFPAAFYLIVIGSYSAMVFWN